MEEKRNLKPSSDIVPNASYCIYEGEMGVMGGISSSSKYVTFYESSGDVLEKIEHHYCFPIIERKLDPQAPKPQPAACTLHYWPAIRLIGKATKGVPGDFIAFYDKNGNTIVSHRINIKDDTLEPLLAQIQEELGHNLNLSKIRPETIVDMRLQDKAHAVVTNQENSSGCRLF